MRHLALFLVGVFATVSSAVLTSTSNFDAIEIGSPFTITWSGASGAVTITISASGTYIGVIASGLTGTSYIWTPSASSFSTNTQYALGFTDSSSTSATSGNFEFSSSSSGALSSLSSTSASSASSISGTATSSPNITGSSSSQTSAASTATSTNASEAGLSTGTKTGIGIGVALGGLLILSLLGFAFWYGRRSAARKAGKKAKDGEEEEVLGENGIVIPGGKKAKKDAGGGVGGDGGEGGTGSADGIGGGVGPWGKAELGPGEPKERVEEGTPGSSKGLLASEIDGKEKAPVPELEGGSGTGISTGVPQGSGEQGRRRSNSEVYEME